MARDVRQFADFELDLAGYELRRQGRIVRLEKIPMEVLILLLKTPGELVSREQIIQEIWGKDVFVDTEHGINTAIRKIRQALKDDPERSQFIQTVVGRGYRFLSPVTSGEEGPGSVKVSGQPPWLAGWKPGTLPAWLKVAIAAGLLAGAGIALWRMTPAKPTSSVIAVLPLKNLSSEPESDYFSDGLTDEIIRNLSIIDGLQVTSRTSSFVFKDKPRNVREVGALLGANYVVEGSVLRSGDKLRVNVQLIRASDDFAVWSERFDREVKDVFVIQDEISHSIVNGLRLKLGSGQRRYNTNLEAYDLYLRAEALGNLDIMRHRPEQLESIALYKQVLVKDPNFAPAYAGIASVYASLSTSPRSLPPDEVYATIRSAAEKALELDPLLAEAYDSMGIVDSRDRAWPLAEKRFRHSIELNPSLAKAHRDLAMYVLFPEGRLEESAGELRRAGQMDPLSAKNKDFLSYVLVSAGRYDEVIENCRRILANDPADGFAEQLYGRALLQKGDLPQATAIFEKLGKGSEAYLGYAYARGGRRAEAQQLVARYPEFPWVQLLVAVGMGDKDSAFQGLEKMAAIKDPRIGAFLSYPELAPLRGDARLNALRRKLGLTELP